MSSFEQFEAGGVVIDFDRTKCLPPDAAGVAMGHEAAQVINYLRYDANEPNMRVRALDMGTGSGVCLAALLHGLETTENVSVTGMDIDESAVAITNRNIDRYVAKDGHAAESDIFTGDWYDGAVWQRLEAQRYDVIVCNPPYLAPGTPLMLGYETVPHSAMYAEGDGLEHHRFLLPKMLGSLSLRDGAAVIARFHSTLRGENELSREIDTVIDESCTQLTDIPFGISLVRRHLSVVAAERNMATVTFSQTSKPVVPHLYYFGPGRVFL